MFELLEDPKEYAIELEERKGIHRLDPYQKDVALFSAGTMMLSKAYWLAGQTLPFKYYLQQYSDSRQVPQEANVIGFWYGWCHVVLALHRTGVKEVKMLSEMNGIVVEAAGPGTRAYQLAFHRRRSSTIGSNCRSA
jgi:hypothetical protein